MTESQPPMPAPWTADADANRRWIDSGGAEGATAQWIGDDLTGVDLRRVVLAEATLIQSNFTAALLEDADLSYSNAGGARFDRSQMTRAAFVKAELSGASFVGAAAPGARFVKATLRDAWLDEADLQGATFDQANLYGARLAGADLRGTSWWKAVLANADLSRCDLRGAHFADTQLDVATRLQGSVGLDKANVESILVGGLRLVGADARAWLVAQANRATWSIEDLELWLLAKMSGPRVSGALRGLGKTDGDLRRVAAELGSVFDQAEHAAAEYRRILGAPAAATITIEIGKLAGSLRYEYRLPLWPDVAFVVNEHPDGYAWGASFRGGPDSLPAELAMIEPWRWSLERLQSIASHIEIVDQSRYDLDAILTFANGARFRSRFDFELLQSWLPDS